MKRILVDGNLILAGLKEDCSSASEFHALWELLQSAQVEGYITQTDLACLKQTLNREIGPQAAEALVRAVQQVVRVYTATRPIALDAILTRSPEQFEPWNVPTLDTASFLQRYNLDCLLALTLKTSLPVVEATADRDRQRNTSLLIALLIVPLLLQIWTHRERIVTELVAAVNEFSKPALPDPSDLQGAKLVSQAPPDPTPFPGVVLPDISGVDIRVAEGTQFGMQLGSDGAAIIIHLTEEGGAIAQAAPTVTLSQGEAGQLVVQMVQAPAGEWIAVTTAPGSPAASALAPEPVAGIKRLTDGRLVAIAPAVNSGSGVPPYQATATATPTTDLEHWLVAVRYSDRTTISSPAPGQAGIEIRIHLEPDGTHDVTLKPILPMEAIPLPGRETEGQKTLAGRNLPQSTPVETELETLYPIPSAETEEGFQAAPGGRASAFFAPNSSPINPPKTPHLWVGATEAGMEPFSGGSFAASEPLVFEINVAQETGLPPVMAIADAFPTEIAPDVNLTQNGVMITAHADDGLLSHHRQWPLQLVPGQAVVQIWLAPSAATAFSPPEGRLELLAPMVPLAQPVSPFLSATPIHHL